MGVSWRGSVETTSIVAMLASGAGPGVRLSTAGPCDLS